MAGGPMDWWYWFGMWIAGLTSVILVWWSSLDAFRHKGSVSRFTWPIVALTGIVLQIPAFTVVGEAQASAVGTSAAVAGVIGITVVGIASVAYFTKGTGSGSTWFTRTRDNDSFLTGPRGRRAGGSSARASVPLSRETPRPKTARTPTPVDFSAENTGNLPGRPKTVMSGAPAAARDDDDKTIIASDETMIEDMDATDSTSADTTLVEQDETIVDHDETVLDEAIEIGATEAVEDEPSAVLDPTLVDEVDSDATITDDPTFATVMEEEDYAGGRLVITDGRSSRIMITERSGAFVVGRDPVKSNLAVDDQKVSRAHFAITLVDSDYIITDLDSSNGTFLNGELLREARVLSDGDTIEFGKVISKFVIDGSE